MVSGLVNGRSVRVQLVPKQVGTIILLIQMDGWWSQGTKIFYQHSASGFEECWFNHGKEQYCSKNLYE